MVTGFWLTRNGYGGYNLRSEPRHANPRITVRKAEPEAGIPWDGIWLHGERLYDAFVSIDGTIEYRSPVDPATGEGCFARHEQRGGGRAP